MNNIDILAGSLAGNVELISAMREAIKKLDNHIAKNPLASTELPEIRATLSKALSKHAGILALLEPANEEDLRLKASS